MNIFAHSRLSISFSLCSLSYKEWRVLGDVTNNTVWTVDFGLGEVIGNYKLSDRLKWVIPISKQKNSYSQLLMMCVLKCVRKTTESDYYLRYVCLSFRLCVCPCSWNNSASNERIFMAFDV
jgi:hypothetical protein